MKKLIVIMLIGCTICFSGSVSASETKGKINLNTATSEELATAGIDEELIRGIMELKEENGEFVDIEELLDVEGVDAKLLRELKKKLYIKAAAGCNC